MKQVIRSAKSRWLNDEDVTDILANFISYGFPISSSAAQNPICSGSLFLYNTSLGTDWRKDGYSWAPEKEKIVRLETTIYGQLNCMVSTDAEMSRRGYWLEAQANIVLAHYLDTSAELNPKQMMPIFSSSLGHNEMMMANSEKSETKCDLFLNNSPEFPSTSAQGQGMRRIKTSPGALSSLATPEAAFEFATPVNPTHSGLGLSVLNNNASPTGATGGSGNESVAITNIQQQQQQLQQQQQQQQQQQAYYMFGAGSALIPTAQSMNSAIVASAAANAAAAARGQAGSKAAMNGMRRIMSSPVALDRLGKQANAAARGMLDPNKTSKRKARKAEVARACRKRKKAYIQSLEQKAAVLTKQLSEMSGKARPMKSEEEVHRLEQDQLLSEMEKLLSNRHCNTKDVKKLVSKFAANSRRHQKTYWKHVDSAKKAITPGAQAKFALWSLDQDDEFYTKPGLWKTLINGEISLDDNQVKKLLQLRQEVTESKYELLGLQKKFIDLSNDVNEHLAKRHRLIDMLMETLKPAQAARFFLWVSKNSSCMQMLQTVWKIPEVQNDQESMKS
mmetsp:Transcript_6626/g.12191  ORF Transcript_6626/g.12191 Transcript_6626/m.12191 type:complete len:561 (+) Transcript_6626:36-1718(+)